MAREQILEEKQNGRKPTAIDYVLANHQGETGDAQLEFESDEDLMAAEFERIRTFVEQRNKQKRSSSVFFRVNNQPVLGTKGQLLQAGAIPLFQGAALDLTNAQLTGEKKFLKPPEAHGSGGILVLAPQKFNQGITLPIGSLNLKENYVEGEIPLNNRSGFHGDHIRLTAEKIRITMDQAEFVNPKMVYKNKEEESSVPIPEKVTVTKEGIAPSFLTSNLRIHAPSTAIPEVTNATDAAETTETTETTEVATMTVPDTTTATEETEIAAVQDSVEEVPEVTEEAAKYEPDRVIFQHGKGRIRAKEGVRPQLALTKYDKFSVEWRGGRLLAFISIGSNELELELETGETPHTYYSDNLSVEVEDKTGFLNGILGDMGISGAEFDTSDLCYNGLEITEEGIFYTSLRDSKLAANIGDAIDLKLGRTTGVVFSNDIITEETSEDGSYYDLAKAVLEHFGILQTEGESEEDAEKGDNNFNLSVPFFTFPLIPGLMSVDAEFHAGAYIGYKVGGSVNNLIGMLKKQQGEAFGVDLRAALQGEAHAGFGVGLTAGPSFLLNLKAQIGANILLTGSEDGNNILETSVHADFKKKPYGPPSLEKAVFDAKGELRLLAVIDASLNTQILGWEKKLYSYEFKNWELAAMRAEIMATRAKENGKAKWKADADLSYSALSGKVKGTLDNKDELQKMIHKQEETNGQSSFDASQESFEAAKKMLLEYHKKSQPVFISTDASNSGFLDMNEAIHKIQHQFYIQLERNQQSAQEEMANLDKLNRDDDYYRLGNEMQMQLNRHSGNLKNIEMALAANTGGATAASKANQKPSTAGSTNTPSENIKNAYIAGGGNYDAFLSHLKTKSSKAAVSVDSLISYEENRRKELTQNSEKRIQAMRVFAAQKGILEDDKTKASLLLPEYRRLKGRAVNKALFTDIPTLLKYEEDRIQEKRSNEYSRTGSSFQKHQERFEELTKKFPEIVQNGSDTPNAEFVRTYFGMYNNFGMYNSLDLFSNSERLLAYERSMLAKKLQNNKKGLQAYQDQTQLHQLLSLGVRDQSQQEQLDTLVSSGIDNMNKDKAVYMTATKEDFVEALIEKRKALALQQNIKQEKNKKNEKWLYNAMELDLTLDDLIAYETKCMGRYKNEKIKAQYVARINFLTQKKYQADGLRASNPEEAERMLYDTIQMYFGYRENKDSTVTLNQGKGFQKDVLERIEAQDASVQKLFQSKNWTPEEAKDIQEMREDPSSIYTLLRKYSIMQDSSVNHEKNIQVLKEHLMKKGPKTYTMEDLDRYYTYQIHRASKADHFSGKKMDHQSILEALEGMTDYPAMLKLYKKMGRGDGFLLHEQADAPNWVTPNMILQYERGRMQAPVQKHLDRIEALRAAESGTAEEQAQAIKEYAESSKRFNSSGGDETVKISLMDIINAERARQAAKMAGHDRRIAMLRSTDPEMTDEAKIEAYDGSRFKPAKEETERIFNEYQQKISSNPASMAEELTAFENQEKEKIEARMEEWKQIKNNILERIRILAEQIKQCSMVINDTEKAIADPESIITSESNTDTYISNVLEKTETDMQLMPQIIEDTSK